MGHSTLCDKYLRVNYSIFINTLGCYKQEVSLLKTSLHRHKFNVRKRWFYKFCVSTIMGWAPLYIFSQGHVFLAVLYMAIGIFIALTM